MTPTRSCVPNLAMSVDMRVFTVSFADVEFSGYLLIGQGLGHEFQNFNFSR